MKYVYIKRLVLKTKLQMFKIIDKKLYLNLKISRHGKTLFTSLLHE